MLLDIVIVLLAATGTVFLIRFVFGLMLMPVRGEVPGFGPFIGKRRHS